MSDNLELDEYLPPPGGENGPEAISGRLVATCDEFLHLRGGCPSIRFLMRTSVKIKAGRQVLGTCYQPMVQGELRPMFDWLLVQQLGCRPDFLIVLDHEYWQDADDLAREILVFHELMHCDQAKDQHGVPKYNKDTGLPVWKIRGHDVEEFVDVVRRYGAYSQDVKAFVEAAGGDCGRVPVLTGTYRNNETN
jgi:hypothetical protein